ncbi:unnamed protein product [Rotaria sp. Silwood2]|nr:unnamed protein product [Rotaria sp. Silwood2]CAF2544021.1 unnamed protein product [Rotaria sp. Silwood2]CAF2795545.1 unnamed protein product [Rotaria sp. Silwood2]CAF2924543.1 unnamed protein product [Rotaria sp. Silwood2]CAF3910085.1 unnamed protein product [Rotaria sp. Silwood2]
MGCCKSSLCIDTLYLHRSNSTRIFSSFTQAEIVQLATLLSKIPDHCQEAIINLPARKLLNLYQYHLMALHHGLQREWLLAVSCEQHVINGLQALMPTEKDHYIFFHFYSVLSACFLALGEIQTAIEGLNITLAILLKYTPMDYETISNHYCHLANVYKIIQNWEAATQCITKAIEIARLSNDLDQEYMRILETNFQLIK